MAFLKRIYIIEDDPGILEFVSILLNNTGWAEPFVFSDALEGLEACLKHPPNCVVLDLELPYLRGEEICRILRSTPRFSRIPIIIMSHLPDAKRREMEMLKLGADAYFEKPFDTDAFLNQILMHASLRGFEEAEEGPLPPSSLPLRIRDEMKDIFFHGYEILEKIGGGSMGTVYKARQTSLDRLVALKVLSPQMRTNSQIYTRFEREAKVLALLNHPHIVQIFDVGFSTYAPFFAMEFVDGTNLYKKIREKPLTLPECLSLIRQTSEALVYLHSRGVIHRDFKASNILISKKRIAKLTDFGVCRAHLPRDVAELTHISLIVGTPSYIAPEVLQGEPATHLSDQFSFGMTVLNMFSTRPFETTENSLEFLREDLPGNIAPVLERCFRENPQERYPSIAEARDAILQILGATPADSTLSS